MKWGIAFSKEMNYLMREQQEQEEEKKQAGKDEIALYLGELEKSLSGHLGRKVIISTTGKKAGSAGIL